MGAITEFILNRISDYQTFVSILPPIYQKLLNLFLLIILVSLYVIFIWKFYEEIATKNILGLNLSKYNKSDHPIASKFYALVFYFLEYIIILPFLIFFWFSIFAIFLILMNEGKSLETILLISAAIIATIRMTSYYNENLSKEIAKLLPLTLLAISLTTPEFFNIERILTNISQISTFGKDILAYFIFIIILEIVLRFFDFIISLFGLDDPKIKDD